MGPASRYDMAVALPHLTPNLCRLAAASLGPQAADVRRLGGFARGQRLQTAARYAPCPTCTYVYLRWGGVLLDSLTLPTHFTDRLTRCTRSAERFLGVVGVCGGRETWLGKRFLPGCCEVATVLCCWASGYR